MTNLQLEAVNNLGMRVLGGTQHEVIALEHVDDAGIALHQSGRNLDHAGQNLMESLGGCELVADLME